MFEVVSLSVIIGSIVIIIIITILSLSGTIGSNELIALMSGYSGLLLGLLFISILVTKKLSNENQNGVTYILSMFPFIFIMFIISFILFLLYTYFDIISKGNVSGYYYSFSILSCIFILTQISILLHTIFTDKTGKINTDNINISFSNTERTLIGLLGTINLLIVITIENVLRFYLTQG